MFRRMYVMIAELRKSGGLECLFVDIANAERLVEAGVLDTLPLLYGINSVSYWLTFFASGQTDLYPTNA